MKENVKIREIKESEKNKTYLKVIKASKMKLKSKKKIKWKKEIKNGKIKKNETKKKNKTYLKLKARKSKKKSIVINKYH